MFYSITKKEREVFYSIGTFLKHQTLPVILINYEIKLLHELIMFSNKTKITSACNKLMYILTKFPNKGKKPILGFINVFEHLMFVSTLIKFYELFSLPLRVSL